MRLFVAAYPPPEVCAHLGGTIDGLAIGRAAAAGVNARVAPRDNWHVTLVFIGEVPDERRSDVESAIGDGIERWRAALAKGRPLPNGLPRLGLSGGGRFGRGQFTVLWVGLRGDVPAVAGLGTAMRRTLKRAKVPYDTRPLRPHLTLARPGDRLDVTDDVAALHAYAGPEWPLDEIHLMRAHLGPKPTYDRLRTWRLDG